MGLRETTNRLKKKRNLENRQCTELIVLTIELHMRETARLWKRAWERRTREMLGKILTSKNEGTASKCPCGISTKKSPFKFDVEFFENFG